MKKGGNNLTVAQLDSETLNLLLALFKLYTAAKSKTNSYKNSEDSTIPRTLIQQYYKYVSPEYSVMLDSFRKKYITNEVLVEKNNSPGERKGMSLVYDYIQTFDVEKDNFSIFINAMEINRLLFKPLDDKYKDDYEKQVALAFRLQEEAKKEKNMAKYKEAKEILTNQQNVKFGGTLRQGPVVMQKFNVEVPSPDEARKIFNTYLNPDKVKEYENILKNGDLIEYINYCVKTTADLIGIQPFSDGNKRTFRSLLNLMFKKRNLPPVYIVKKENEEYHNALEKAIANKDYRNLQMFYYKKICDSIYELDFVPYIATAKANHEAFDGGVSGYKNLL